MFRETRRTVFERRIRQRFVGELTRLPNSRSPYVFHRALLDLGYRSSFCGSLELSGSLPEGRRSPAMSADAMELFQTVSSVSV